MRNKKMLILLLCLICLILVLGVGCGSNEESDSRIVEVNKLVLDNKFDEARIKAKELFKNSDKLEDILMDINESEEIQRRIDKSIQEFKDIKNKYENLDKVLEIQPNDSYKIKGDYIYITGKVKNISSTDINYFEVVVDFLDDKGNIINSDYTNDGLTLKPDAIREFEIMHKYNSEYDSYQLSIGDVK